MIDNSVRDEDDIKLNQCITLGRYAGRFEKVKHQVYRVRERYQKEGILSWYITIAMKMGLLTRRQY